MKNGISLTLEPELQQRLADLFGSLFLDLARCLNIQIVTDADDSVDGADNGVLRAWISPDAIDQQLRSALSARGIDLNKVGNLNGANRVSRLCQFHAHSSSEAPLPAAAGDHDGSTRCIVLAWPHERRVNQMID